MGPSQHRLLIVPVGVIAGHSIGYHLAHPDAIERASSLGSSHGYLGPAAVVSIVAATIGVAWVALDAVRQRDRVPSAFVLARWQAAAFLTVEVVERLDHHNPIAATAGERAVWVGLAVQALLAVVATRALHATRRLVEALTPPASSRRPRPLVPATPVVERGATPHVQGASLGRAPPPGAFA